MRVAREVNVATPLGLSFVSAVPRPDEDAGCFSSSLTSDIEPLFEPVDSPRIDLFGQDWKIWYVSAPMRRLAESTHKA